MCLLCTYVRVTVKIPWLRKDKLCINIPGRINILIPFFLFDFLPSRTALLSSFQGMIYSTFFFWKNSSPKSTWACLCHYPEPCPSMTKRLHFSRNRRSLDFKPIILGRNMIPWKKPHYLWAALLLRKCKYHQADPCKLQCPYQAAGTQPALCVHLKGLIQISVPEM